MDRDLDSRVAARAARHLRAFRKEVEDLFPGRVRGVVLFGSRARGDAERASDYDVAVFIDDLTVRRPVDHALADAAYEHILAGIHIRPVSIASHLLEASDETPLASGIAREGVAVCCRKAADSIRRRRSTRTRLARSRHAP
ncbi:MAG: polymerase beta domain protein region [Caulobacter sp.]|nr:polymerase beta domain protein region [Caulobacter sp.]